jgi:hypothetical protein
LEDRLCEVVCNGSLNLAEAMELTGGAAKWLTGRGSKTTPNDFTAPCDWSDNEKRMFQDAKCKTLKCMPPSDKLRWVLPFLLFVPPAPACQCVQSLSACSTVAATSLVFIGTVKSIEPAFLSRWDKSNHSALQVLNEAYGQAREHPTAETLANVKLAFQKAVPELTGQQREHLEAAKTVLEIASLFNAQVYQGMRVRLDVRTYFKHEEKDNDPRRSRTGANDRKPDDDNHDGDSPKKDKADIVEVWTSFGDCGVEFQVGENYLVYADEDEGSNQLFSDKCSRTRRLSDAGEDLVYLYFFKDHREESSRLEGFATTDSHTILDYGSLPDTIASPATGVVVELRSNGLIRYTESSSSGRYLFDGLPEGDYRLSAFSADYPQSLRQLAGPYSLHLEENDCAQRLLVVKK